MTLAAGTRVGSYEVVSPLGVGGMGEVYRARDTRLHREVAVKVLPEHLATDRDRLARFEREAQVLAALNHPHIAHIYGFEESPSTGSGHTGVRAIVLELVEGETLAERIAQGPLPLDEALPIARQIAEALVAAHEQGIIHRDLKPANIKITPAGVVKVLDFGLAKLADSVARSPTHSSHSISPTLTSPVMTGIGTILGTAAYMAPEQAKGRPADKRSDMWAFGCVLYEMLTGTRTFDGDDVSDTMAAVLRAEPDWNKLSPEVTPALRALLRRCLEKDRNQRVVDAGAALFVLNDLALLQPVTAAGSIRSQSPRRTLALAGIAVGLGAALAATGTWIATRPDPPPVVRFEVTPPAQAPLSVGQPGINLLISPDGKRVAYHRVQGNSTVLEVRSLESGEDTSLPRTELAGSPAFSPDSQQLAFFKAGKLYKIAIDSRALVAVADVSDGTGISWGVPDTIVFSRPGPRGGIFRIAATGGAPELLAAPKGTEQDYIAPEMVPDGSAVVFVVRTVSGGNSRFSVAARSMTTGEQRIVADGAVSPRYVAGDYLVYLQGAVLTGARFDTSRLALAGSAVPLVNGLVSKGAVANFGISRNGTLVYIPGSTINYVTRFIWRTRDGKLVGPAAPDQLQYPRYPKISPDGRKFVATIGPAQEGHIWVYDIASASQPYKLTFTAHNSLPTWSPDGSRIAFTSTRDGPTRNLFAVPADGSVVEPVRLVTGDKDKTQLAWAGDGSLIYQQLGDSTRQDLWTQPADADGKGKPWLQTTFAETSPVVSTDGKWLAFVANTTGTDEVYVRPYPGPGSPLRVSSAGGHEPVWSRDGKELFYQEGSKLMAAAVTSTAPLQLQAPRMLFDGGFVTWDPNTPRTYDVAKDGRFLMIEPSTRALQRMDVVLNWVEEVKRLIP